GWAARNINGKVILYADRITESMEKAMGETNRRRTLQAEYNEKHGITPKGIRKAVAHSTEDFYQFCEADEGTTDGPRKILKLKDGGKVENISVAEVQKKISKLKKSMKKASDQLEFEEAAGLRDEIKRLELKELFLREGADMNINKN